MADNKPTSRSDFQIAIICALELEAEAVLYLFDRTWDGNGDPFGKAARDPNHYRTGQLGKHNVVLVTLPGIGKVNAATAAAALLSSYTNIRLALIVGICGGVPSPPNLKEEILLGDVVISDAVVQFDFGRRYPDGNFHIKSNIKERLGKADNNVKSLLKIFGTQQGKDLLECGAFKNLKTLQKNELVAAKRNGRDGNIYSYPGITKDKRYKPLHVHRHRKDTACGCTDRHACQTAREESCESLGCEDSELLVTRTRRLELKRKLDSKNDMRVQAPSIFMGAMASGDTVMKSGEDRDRIAKEEGVIAFEMEGAGVWEQPYTSCLLIKGVCDYADSHKNKDWQYFAAATAAAVMKALLGFCARAERPDGERKSERHCRIIFILTFVFFR